MSKMSYCSLEEAWGDSYSKNNNENINDNITNNSNNSNNDVKGIQNNRITNRDKYETLNQKSENERKNVITNMNKIERNNVSENNSIVEYDKYRFNSENKVNNNNYEKDYTPFQESLEKKYLKDKLIFLENEFKKYKDLIEKAESNKNYNNNRIENFSNNEVNDENMEVKNKKEYSNNNNDFVDLIILIIIGLIIIFVMNSIFNIGKSIGKRHSTILS
jgi:hypothetical protein